MKFTAREIAALLGGTVEGNPETIVTRLSKIEEGEEGTLSFLSNPLYESHVYSTDASILIVNSDFAPAQKLKPTLTLIRVDDSRQAFGKLLEAYNRFRLNKKGVDNQASISSSAKIGKDVYVGALAYIGENAVIGDNAKIYPQVFIGDNVKVGANTILYPGVKVYHDCIIGNNCILQSGVIIGGDGFGFQPNSDNNYQKLPHIGNAVIKDHVEIGANTTVDRATLGSTIIGKGVKLDNLIQIAHNVEIGENTIIAAQSGVAGSTKIGRDCMIGGQVGIIGHLEIGNRVKIAAQSGIGNNLKDDEVVQGSPAFAIGDYKRSYVIFRNLPAISTTIKQLQKQLGIGSNSASSR